MTTTHECAEDTAPDAGEYHEDCAQCECGDTGYLVDQTYGSADIPEGCVPVQSCDLCRTLPDDEDAAKAYAATLGTFYGWADGSVDDDGEQHPGDWWVRIEMLATIPERNDKGGLVWLRKDGERK